MAFTLIIGLLPYTGEVVKAYPPLKAQAKSRQLSAPSAADSIFPARWDSHLRLLEHKMCCNLKEKEKEGVAPLSAQVW